MSLCQICGFDPYDPDPSDLGVKDCAVTGCPMQSSVQSEIEATQEPRGCPTPGACSALAVMRENVELRAQLARKQEIQTLQVRAQESLLKENVKQRERAETAEHQRDEALAKIRRMDAAIRESKNG